MTNLPTQPTSEDTDYLLALAEEEHLRRERLYQERLRCAEQERRRERHLAACSRLRDEIERLARAPFSWQVQK